MSLLLLFRRGYGDWPETPVVPTATTTLLKPRHRLVRWRAQQTDQ